MITFGIDTFLKSAGPIKSLKMGLVTNDAAHTSSGIKSRVALKEAGFTLRKLFTPEHGITNTAEDGAFVSDGIDTITRLPIISLYGERLKPDKEDFSDLDFIVFDIPDIGTRFYTFLWTMTYVLEACGEQGLPLIILDRPNPLSGRLDLAEGPGLDESTCSSFIGRWDIPLRHSCTLGELALYFNESRKLNADIEVIKCEGWSRDMFFPEWGIPFIPTSPAIRAFQTVTVYPGTGLLEATNISEGRDSSLPFQVFGAPWIHPTSISKLSEKVPNVKLTPHEFLTYKYPGLKCFGAKLEIPDYRTYRPVSTALNLIKAIYDSFPIYFKWEPYMTRANPSGENHLDFLLGVQHSNATFQLSEADFKIFWEEKTRVSNWHKKVSVSLLY